MLAVDLFIAHREDHEVRFREAALWSAIWIALSLAFNGLVWHWFGRQRALEFLTAYLVEKTLSVDNLFVFLVLFSSFAVPPKLVHRVLFWGVLGALVLRGIFIGLGTALVQRFEWIMYVFGAILVVTGAKLLFQEDAEPEPEKNPLFRLFRRFVPSVSTYHGRSFWIRRDGKLHATPLLLVLVAIEATDVVFAVDSIPAVFGVSRDPFIVYTSNIFAILGLRSLFLLLAGVISKLRYLKTGLAFVLIFIGAKMVAGHWYHVPIGVSLAVIASLLGTAIAASLLNPLPEEEAAALTGAGGAAGKEVPEEP